MKWEAQPSPLPLNTKDSRYFTVMITALETTGGSNGVWSLLANCATRVCLPGVTLTQVSATSGTA